jgi:NodT family efflux transporter outer membrane factor (OMF) lipoprotein
MRGSTHSLASKSHVSQSRASQSHASPPHTSQSHLLWLSSLIIVCAGCATVPDALAPITPVNVQGTWQSTAATKAIAQTEPVLQVAWWQQLADPELHALVRAALTNSPDEQIAAARLAGAQASLAAAKAQAWPELGLTLGSERQAQSSRSFKSTQFDDVNTSGRRIDNRHRVEADARWEPDIFGRRALEQTAAQAQLQAVADDAISAQQTLVADVVSTYVDLTAVDAQLPLLIEARQWAERAAAAARQRLKAGLATAEQVRERDNTRSLTLSRIEEARAQRVIATSRLAALTGQAAHEFNVRPTTAALLTQTPFSQIQRPIANLPAEVIAKRADVKAAWQRVTSTATTAERARLDRFPTITLTSASGYASDAFRRWLSGDTLSWTLGLRVAVPLLDGGRIHANVSQAQSVVQEREGEYRKVVLLALQDVQSALVQLERADSELQFARESLARLIDDAAAAQRLLQAGKANSVTLADTERARTAAAVDLINAQRVRLTAIANLNRALASPIANQI